MYNKYVNLNLMTVVLSVLSVATVFLSIIYLYTDWLSPKLESIISGLITGLFVACVQVGLNWYEYKKLDKFTTMKVLDVRPNRDSREFYEQQIKESKSQIDIMGVTADRLIDHFADNKSDQERSKVLLRALERNVKIRILLPKKEFLENDKSSAFDKVNSKLQELSKEYANLEYRYFSYPPKHSIFRIDETCIVGPVFPERQSKDTPAIHFLSNSPFATKYLAHFNTEWTTNSDV